MLRYQSEKQPFHDLGLHSGLDELSVEIVQFLADDEMCPKHKDGQYDHSAQQEDDGKVRNTRRQAGPQHDHSDL